MPPAPALATPAMRGSHARAASCGNEEEGFPDEPFQACRGRDEREEMPPWQKSWKTGTEDDYWVRSCAGSAPGCHPVGCGVKLHVVDGRLVEVKGDENHPITQGRLCVRCLALPEYVYNPKRIVYPMKRAFEDRGLDKWERITWDEAIDTIVEKTQEIQAKYGNDSVIVFGGTGREGLSRTARPFPPPCSARRITCTA